MAEEATNTGTNGAGGAWQPQIPDLKNFDTTLARKKIVTLDQLAPVAKMPSDILSFDYGSGGGLPLSAITHLWGPYSGGKTALLCGLMGYVQRRGGSTFFADGEGLDRDFCWTTYRFDPLDKRSVRYLLSNDAGEVLEGMEEAIDAGFDMVTLDSFDSILTEAQDKASHDDAMMAQKARLGTLSFAKINAALVRQLAAGKPRTMVIIISQLRQRPTAQGGGEYPSAGNALLHFEKLQLYVRRGWVKKGKEGAVESAEEKDTKDDTKAVGGILGANNEPIGHYIDISVRKSKVGIPFGRILLPVLYYKGFDPVAQVVDVALQVGTLKGGGSNNEIAGVVVRGRDNLVEALRTHPEMVVELEAKTRQRMSQIAADRVILPPSALLPPPASEITEPVVEVEKRPPRKPKETKV